MSRATYELTALDKVQRLEARASQSMSGDNTADALDHISDALVECR